MTMYKLKDPGPARGGGVIQGAVRFAKKHPGEWVLARTYKNNGSARSTAAGYRKSYPEIEWVSRGLEMYLKVPGVETK